MIALPIFLQIKLEYDALQTGLSIAPLSLTMFAVAILAGRKSGGRRPAKIIRTGFALSTLGLALIIPIVPDADSGWYLVIPLVIAGAGLGLLVSQLNNYTLAPIDDERISEAAGVNSASGSFGLSFGLAVAGGVLLATLSLAFTNMTNASPVIPSTQQQQIAQTLEDDAQVVSNTQLDKLLADEPPAVREEILEHQHRRDEPRPAGGAARADPRGPPRVVRLVPHDPPTGHRALGLRRSSGIGLTELPGRPERLALTGGASSDERRRSPCSEGPSGEESSARAQTPRRAGSSEGESRSAWPRGAPSASRCRWRRTASGRRPIDRPDPVGILEEQNATRVPELVPIRHGRMIVSPFTFYRGSAAIMAWDLSRTPTTGLRVQCCGDAHLSNFGVFAAPDRRARLRSQRLRRDAAGAVRVGRQAPGGEFRRRRARQRPPSQGAAGGGARCRRRLSDDDGQGGERCASWMSGTRASTPTR